MTRIGTELNGLLAAMSLLSEGQTQKWDAVKGGDAGGEPPRAWQDQKSTYDEWHETLQRVAESMRVEMSRAQGTAPRAVVRREELEQRVIYVWEGKPVAFIAYVEQLPELDVVRIRRAHNREVSDGTKVEG